MFNFLVTASLRNRLFVLAAALLLIVYGAITLRTCRSTCSPTSTGRPSR